MDRRQFFSSAAAVSTVSATAGISIPFALGGSAVAADRPLASLTTPPPRTKPPGKKLCILTSTYHYLSHAYHIGGRFIDGYRKDGKHHYPDSEVSSIFVDRPGKFDLAKDIAKPHGIAIAPSIEAAILNGDGKTAVDGVLLICEHGDYPYNEKGQKLYPRFEMFQSVVGCFRRAGKVLPVFVDKHLSYDRHKAAKMVATAREMKFPLFAGSSLPVTWRRPELELPLGSKVEEALVVSRGEMEIYGIHALEALQCMVERRAGAEQGVKRVEYLEGEAVWKAGDGGRWSWNLLEHALSRSPSRNAGNIRDNCRRFRAPATWGFNVPSPRAFLIEYRDGLRATVLQIDGHSADETFAAKLRGQKDPVSTLFFLPPPPGAAFLEALAIHVERLMDTGRPSYPAERTQLTGGILDCVLESRIKKAPVDTPELEISYKAPADSGFMRGSYERPN